MAALPRPVRRGGGRGQLTDDANRHPVLGGQRDAAQDDRVGSIAGWLELHAGRDHAQQLGHLGLGERRADAAPDPAAEGQPGGGLGTVVGEALGPERVGVGVEVGRWWTSAIAGYTLIPGGSSQPATVRGRVSVRSAASMTGRSRSVSLPTASRYRLSSRPMAARARASTSGWRRSRSIAKARPVAVVSWPAASVDDGDQRRPEPLDARRLGHAEHRPADDLEGEGAHPLAHDELLPRPPAGDLPLGHVADDVAERRHARSLERRQEQLALAQVLGSVEHEDRVPAEDRLEDAVGLAREQVRLVAGQQLADRARVGDVDAGAEAEVSPAAA